MDILILIFIDARMVISNSHPYNLDVDMDQLPSGPAPPKPDDERSRGLSPLARMERGRQTVRWRICRRLSIGLWRGVGRMGM